MTDRGGIEPRAWRALDRAPTHRALMVSPELDIVWATESLLDLLGHEHDEFVGRAALDFVHPDDVPGIAGALSLHRELSHVFNANRVELRSFDLRVRAADGTWLQLETFASNFFEEPDIQGLLLHVRYIDERSDLRVAVDQIASGAHLHTVLQILCEYSDTNRGDRLTGIVAWNTGTPIAVTRAGVHHLGGHVDDERRAGSAPDDIAGLFSEAIWKPTRDTGAVQAFVELDALPADLVATAHRYGCESVAVLPLFDPGTDLVIGCTVVWRRHSGGGLVAVQQVAPMMHRLAVLAVATDRTKHQLRFAAESDHLTGLANRATFDERLRSCSADAAVLYVDLDDFKPVNDRLGHRSGDEVLIAVAQRLRASVRADDLVARVGGDEFAIVCDSGVTHAELEAIATRAVSSIGEPIECANGHVHVGASIGIAIMTPGEPVDDLLARADTALYTAKQQGKAAVRFAA